MSSQVVYTNQALKDARKIAHGGLKVRAEEILALLEEDSFRTPPPFEKLVGDLAGPIRDGSTCNIASSIRFTGQNAS